MQPTSFSTESEITSRLSENTPSSLSMDHPQSTAPYCSQLHSFENQYINKPTGAERGFYSENGIYERLWGFKLNS